VANRNNPVHRFRYKKVLSDGSAIWQPVNRRMRDISDSKSMRDVICHSPDRDATLLSGYCRRIDAGEKLGIDTVEFKRRAYRPKSSLPCVTPGGQRLETVSFQECLDKLVSLMDYDQLRNEQRRIRERGVHRGIGIATFCEPTAYGPPYYGPSGATISTQDGCTLRLEPSGSLRCITSLTDQGQGTLTSVAQIVADTLGVEVDRVTVMGGDSAISTYGSGAWASRSTAVGGDAVNRRGVRRLAAR